MGTSFLSLAGFTALAFAVPVAAEAPATDPTSFAASADVRSIVESMAQAMKPGQGFLARPLVRGGVSVAALEYWKAPGRPAVHPTDAEYAIVIEGAGTMISGGTLVDPEVTNPGLTQGSRIEGGTTRKLAADDVFLIPAGTPHWFGIDGGKLVLLGIKLPQPAR
jgi:mannose-6-phosphate isomerase-like protein (cupin superfamily)